MSVHGEYQRILSELVAFLERTGAPGSEAWSDELEAAAAQGRENVSEGANRALVLLQGNSVPSFATPLEMEEFARLQEHLVSICRVLLGR